MHPAQSPLDLRRGGLAAAGSAVGLLALIGVCTGTPCVSTGVQAGIWVSRCPATDLRASGSLRLDGLARDRWGTVYVAAVGHWLDRDDHNGVERQASVPRPDILLDLVDASGAVVPGLVIGDVDWQRGQVAVAVKLPPVPDGHYTLRAMIDAGFETIEVVAETPLFTPALVHVVSDRPLYKPGQEVLLRAAVLGRGSGVPIDERPGTWTVRSPDGTEMLVEKRATDAWGVSSTTFPLASDAAVGRWTVEYATGADRRVHTFDLRPFTLPRFTVSVESDRTWYGSDDPVVVSGVARYTSGAPVQDAEVEIRLRRQEGRWPLPLAWEEPFTLRTDRAGRFELALGEVPADLLERSQIGVDVAVVDPNGERRTGGHTLTLSASDLHVQTVTAFEGGLVGDFNNRAYLRVMSPDGRPLANTDLVVRNAYQPSQAEMMARTDVDGVAALQLDPGEPVSLVSPPPPPRVRPFAPTQPQLTSAVVHPGRRGLDLAERRALDAAHDGLSRCGELVVGSASVQVGLQVGSSGRVQRALGPQGVVGDCVEGVMRRVVFPTGSPRTLALVWSVPDALLPNLVATHHAVQGSERAAAAALDDAARLARRCMRRGVGVDNASVLTAHWHHEQTRPLAVQAEVQRGSGLDAGTLACIQRAFTGLSLTESPKTPAMGATGFRLNVPAPPGSVRPSATTTTGFQLTVDALDPDGKVVGTTPVTFPIGALPPLRMRTTPSLASPGDTVEVELLRGPSFVGSLPEELVLRRAGRELDRAKVDPDARTATFTLPADEDGFLAIHGGGARSVLFVRRPNALSVSLETDRSTYRPGENARLTLKTLAGEAPVEASVTLAGVDAALAELVPLTRPDDWGDVTVLATGTAAFGAFGPRALELGQVRGENAAKAAVLSVTDLGEGGVAENVHGSGSYAPPLEEVQVTNFYRALEAFIARIRAWEEAAPDGEHLLPERVAALWVEVLQSAEATDDPLVDGYGRPLSLRLLPADLLEQTTPAAVVADSTRLPEDVVNWADWVEENL